VVLPTDLSVTVFNFISGLTSICVLVFVHVNRNSFDAIFVELQSVPLSESTALERGVAVGAVWPLSVPPFHLCIHQLPKNQYLLSQT